jgi:hypothetical protein
MPVDSIPSDLTAMLATYREQHGSHWRLPTTDERRSAAFPYDLPELAQDDDGFWVLTAVGRRQRLEVFQGVTGVVLRFVRGEASAAP